MKRILMIGMTEGVGGVETFICNIKKFISSDFHIDFLVHQDIDKKYLDVINSNDSKIFHVTGIKVNFIKYIIDIFKFYKNNKFDVVHINECDSKMFFYAIPLLFDKKTKLIIHSHSSSTKNPIIHKILNFFQNKRANLKWACSDVAFNYMFGDNVDKIIIHNGIDLSKFKFNVNNRLNKRNELNITDETVFCSIARFVKEKNHEKIVDIFNSYLKIDSNSKLLLIGNGILKDSIKEKVKLLGINDKVIFLDSRSDIAELLSAVDVFLLPSLFEGLPFVSLEGQACSVRFFASNTVSQEIAVTDLVNFIDLNDPPSIWASKISEVLDIEIDRESEIYHDLIRNSGYDILEVCKYIEKKYEE